MTPWHQLSSLDRLSRAAYGQHRGHVYAESLPTDDELAAVHAQLDALIARASKPREPERVGWPPPPYVPPPFPRARLVTYAGETLSVSAWAKRCGISPTSMAERLERHGVTDAAFGPRRREMVRR